MVEIRAQANNYNMDADFALLERDRDGNVSHFGLASMDSISDGGRIKPFASVPIGSSALQRLMDDLWQMGVRPSQVGTSGHLEAISQHLESMKDAIAFHQDRAIESLSIIRQAVIALLPKGQ